MDIPAPANTGVSSDGTSIKSFLLDSLKKAVDVGLDVGGAYVREKVIAERAARTATEIQEGTSDGPQAQPAAEPASVAAVQQVPATELVGSVFGGGATLSSIALFALVILGVMELTD